ncbi:dual serine/threonine and tyrosine protein kinase-like [Saccoglossus kowalevskii]|uniref:Dual serine/threonine and tyrosine protein kinase-like n=1 Tax=Saccoglossus kowalevskii TaxID=10224 RepID=A0ABM0MQE5_SACKO|nr:PREDICTED: dual serine/threonine and tyrosine protein kinase-like [Saccoglossus kowalevskii]
MSLSLEQVYSEFKLKQKKLGQLYQDTNGYVQRVQSVIRRPLRKKLQPILLSEQDDLNVKRVVECSPKLYVLGHTRCGKKSFINKLLGRKLLPPSDLPCTTTFIKISYCESGYIQMLDTKGTVVKRDTVGEESIPDGYTNSSPVFTTANEIEMIEIGINHPLLENGVTICYLSTSDLDCAADIIRKECKESILLPIIYLVDSNYGIRRRDQQMLCTINNLSADLSIIYVGNKVDVDRVAEAMDMPSDDSDEESGEELSVDKKRITFKTLLDHGFISGDADSVESCRDFYGVSSKTVTGFDNEFQRLKATIASLTQNILNEYTVQASITLHSTLVGLFLSIGVPALRKSDINSKHTAANKELFVRGIIAAHERVEHTTESMTEIIDDALTGSKSVITTLAANMKYDPIKIEHSVHKDEMLIQLRNQVQQLVIMKFSQIMQMKLGYEIENLVKNVTGLLEQGTKSLGKLLANYTCSIIPVPKVSNMQEKLQFHVRSHLIGTHKKQGLRQKLSYMLMGLTVNDKWRETVAMEILNYISVNDIIEIISKDIHRGINSYEKKMLTLIGCLDTMSEVMSLSSDVKDTPDVVTNICYTLQSSEATFASLNYGLLVISDDASEAKQEFSGKRHAIKRLEAWGKFGDVVVRIAKDNKYHKREAVLVSIARHVFNLDNIIVPVLGSVDCVIYGETRIATIVPYIDRNLWTTLSDGSLQKEKVKSRLRIARLLSFGCEYLSDQGFPVVDLRPTNIMLKADWTPTINMLKSRDDSIPYPDGKIPFHIPPEEYTNPPSSDISPFITTNASAVYSFGVLLWLLLLGRFRRPTYADVDDAQKIEIPENNMVESICLIDHKDKKIHNVLKRCFSTDPLQRPSWSKIVSFLA